MAMMSRVDPIRHPREAIHSSRFGPDTLRQELREDFEKECFTGIGHDQKKEEEFLPEK
jgi:hypothetical protein